jgi:hypothetical protein
MAENKIKALDIFYPAQNEFDLIKTLLLIYLNSEKASGRLEVMPSSKLIDLLVFYIKHDYTNEAKEKAKAFMKVEKMQSIDALNHKLKIMGFLKDGAFSKRDKNLSDSLAKLRDYYTANQHNKLVIRSIVYQDNA